MHAHMEHFSPRSEDPSSGDSSERMLQQLNKEPAGKIKDSKSENTEQAHTTGISTLPRITLHRVEPHGAFVSTSQRSDAGGAQHARKDGHAMAPTETAKSDTAKAENEKGKKDKERHARGPKAKFEEEEHDGHNGDRKAAASKPIEEHERKDLELAHAKHQRDISKGPYVEGAGTRNAAEDPDMNMLGKGIINAEISSDNFQLMKAVRGLPEDKLRNEAEHAQSAINRDLDNLSVKIGVDENNIHVYFKRTDMTLPYNAETDKKLAPDESNPVVRAEALERLKSGMGKHWDQGLDTMNTSELLLFDSITRSDGPALRSAMNNIKSADELDKQFQDIAEHCSELGLSNWGNVVWSDDLKSLTVYNGTALYSGKFPLD